jgi:hypothetical protein
MERDQRWTGGDLVELNGSMIEHRLPSGISPMVGAARFLI